MHLPLARELAERGNRVVSLDLLGHGKSARPVDMTAYAMEPFGRRHRRLLDHLDVEDAVVERHVAGRQRHPERGLVAPERIRGMMIEMPVLDNAILGAARVPAVDARDALRGPRAERRQHRREPAADLARAGDRHADGLAARPSGAVAGGPARAVLRAHRAAAVGARTITVPALVVGHPNDPIHPFTDSDELARELPNARLVDAESIVEMRVRPERLTAEIAAFVDECWTVTRAAKRRPAGKRAAPKRRSAA